MCPLFIVGEIRANSLRHDHDQSLISHVHPIAKAALRDCHGRQRANGDGRSVGEMKIADEWRRSFELHDSDVRAEQGYGRIAQSYAGHSRGVRLATMVR
jgi:hypothetical protein